MKFGFDKILIFFFCFKICNQFCDWLYLWLIFRSQTSYLRPIFRSQIYDQKIGRKFQRLKRHNYQAINFCDRFFGCKIVTNFFVIEYSFYNRKIGHKFKIEKTVVNFLVWGRKISCKLSFLRSNSSVSNLQLIFQSQTLILRPKNQSQKIQQTAKTSLSNGLANKFGCKTTKRSVANGLCDQFRCFCNRKIDCNQTIF